MNSRADGPSSVDNRIGPSFPRHSCNLNCQPCAQRNREREMRGGELYVSLSLFSIRPPPAHDAASTKVKVRCSPMGHDSPHGRRPPPEQKQRTDGARREQKQYREVPDRLWFGAFTRLWTKTKSLIFWERCFVSQHGNGHKCAGVPPYGGEDIGLARSRVWWVSLTSRFLVYRVRRGNKQSCE
jgi:hypothetical protein